MNKIGKLLLVVTSLAPVLGALAVNSLAREQYAHGVWFLVIGVLLCLLCFLLLRACYSYLPRELLATVKVKSADKEVLAFLLVYLLPFFNVAVIDFTGNWLTATYVACIILLVVYHSNAVTFNPLLSIAGYRFYEVETDGGMSYIVIGRKELTRQANRITGICLVDYIFLQTE
jgi:hypothetical protein